MRGLVVDADRFCSLRRALGWTQVELALAAGVSERTVRNAERGRPIQYDFLDFMATAMHVPLEELLSDPRHLHPIRQWERRAQRISEAAEAVIVGMNSDAYCQIAHRHIQTRHTAPFQGEFLDQFQGHDGVYRYFDLIIPWLTSLVNRHVQIQPPRGDGNFVLIEGIDSFTVPDDGIYQRFRCLQIYEFVDDYVAKVECWVVPVSDGCPLAG